MNTVFVLIVSCALVYFFPQFKIQYISSFFSIILNFLVKKSSTFVRSIIILVILFLVSFLLPTLLLLYISNISFILVFFIEIFIAYHIIYIPRISDFLSNDTNDKVINASTIIQAIIYFIDYFFIPCLCILLFGLPIALLYRASSLCTKKLIIEDSSTSMLYCKINNVLLFIPSYVMVLALFTTSIFFPFCNTKNAYSVFQTDNKKIQPYWLSRVLAACFGLLCIEIPVSFFENGNIVTRSIGNTSLDITGETVKSLVYLLYSASILIVALMIICRLLVTWGVW